MIIFFKKEALEKFDISMCSYHVLKLGFMNMANKGGTYLKFKVNDTVLGFTNVHLASGREKINI